MRQFDDRRSWQSHISACISKYIKEQETKDSIPCPHPLCALELPSESDLWYHLADVHGTTKPSSGMKRQHGSEEGDGSDLESAHGAATKRPRFQSKMRDHIFQQPETLAPSNSFEPYLKCQDDHSSWQIHDDRYDSDVSLAVLSEFAIAGANHDTANHTLSSEIATRDVFADAEPSEGTSSSLEGWDSTRPDTPLTPISCLSTRS